MQKLSCARPSRSLTPNPLQQCNRAPKPQVQRTHEGGRHLPRRGKRAHTGDRQDQVRCRERVGVAPPPGRIAARQVAVPNGRPPTCHKVHKKLNGTKSYLTRSLAKSRYGERIHCVRIRQQTPRRTTKGDALSV